MLRGFYNAAQGMIIQQRHLDTIANNVANINTAGFKKDEINTNTFMEELILVNRRRETSGTFLQTYVDSSKTNLEQSNFDFTDSIFDVGIFGNMYFNIAADDGNVYQTKNGQFELDSEGYLTLGESGRVQGIFGDGETGDILIGSDDLVIDEEGNLFLNGEPMGALLLTYIPPGADVEKIGHNLYSYAGDEEIPEGESFVVIQGAFETSNVDGNKEMTQAMEVQRMYEASSRALKYLDTVNAKAVGIAALVK